MGTISIRYTKNNKKLSLEHLETICSSYEKVVRDIPKQLLKIEKTVRLKYLEPMSEKRRCDIAREMSTEVELLINGMVDEYRDVYSKHHKTEIKGGYKLIAREGYTVQEIFLTTKLTKESLLEHINE